MTCGAHNNPAQWKIEPAPQRGPGCERMTCAACGKFIGYRVLQTVKEVKATKLKDQKSERQTRGF